MKIEGTMVDLLVQLEPHKYKNFVTSENNKKVLYVRLKKALYETLQAALLFWKKLTSKLQEWGFHINSYNQCVANKTINKKQCTIIWHVDDLKISHIDPEVLSQVIKQLTEVFGIGTPLMVNRGKVHDYLGMNLDFSQEN
jgi:Reverse transcriptase (RNA-dependent DNA polymerase)